jgi:hypothetical protein
MSAGHADVVRNGARERIVGTDVVSEEVLLIEEAISSQLTCGASAWQGNAIVWSLRLWKRLKFRMPRRICRTLGSNP